MGTSNVDESNSTEELKSTQDRPKFYPCIKCGEKFTFRALNVHRKICKESESCKCIVCIHKEKRRKLNGDIENDCLTCEKSDGNTLQNISQNTAPNKLKQILLLNKPSVICKAMPHGQSAIGQSISVEGCNELKEGRSEATDTVLQSSHIISNVEQNALAPNNNSENNAVVNNEETGESLEDLSYNNNKDKSGEKHMIPLRKLFHNGGEQCKRKMFCAMCNNHVFWGTYGTHLLEHCILENGKPICPMCNLTTNSPTNFLIHFYDHYSDHPTNCPDCKCSDKSCQIPTWPSKSEHSYAAHSVNLCFICLDMFSHFQSLINHMRLHSRETPFSCTECPRMFRQVGNLTRHMTTHRGIKPHKCTDCDKSFADPATLRNHVRTHTKETPYICPICKRGFSQVGNLKRHKVVHDQEGSSRVANPSESSDASQIAVESPVDAVVGNPEAPKVIYNQPKRGRHPIEHRTPLQCTECGKKFAWSYDLETHYRVHSGVKPYECDICKKRFAQSGAVRMHKQRHHSDAGMDDSQMNNTIEA